MLLLKIPKLKTSSAILLLTLSVSGCGAGSVIDKLKDANRKRPGPVAVDYNAIFCATSKPRRPTSAEFAVMSPERILEDVKHNERGEKYCGWKP